MGLGDHYERLNIRYGDTQPPTGAKYVNHHLPLQFLDDLSLDFKISLGNFSHGHNI